MRGFFGRCGLLPRQEAADPAGDEEFFDDGAIVAAMWWYRDRDA